eukprot:jgi/Botrbrau1/22233/Bobra.0479s0001.1
MPMLQYGLCYGLCCSTAYVQYGLCAVGFTGRKSRPQKNRCSSELDHMGHQSHGPHMHHMIDCLVGWGREGPPSWPRVGQALVTWLHHMGPMLPCWKQS